MTSEKVAPPHAIVLFLSTFVSTLLFLFGAGTLILMFFPALSNLFLHETYQPQLPIAAARAESFIDIDSIPPKRLYPSTGDVTDAAPGSWIRIPAIDVAVPLVLSPSLEDDDVLATLDLGAALYPNGVEPGNLGNTFVSAHSTGEPWKGKYRFAFLRINDLEPGHELHLDYNGARYTYRITDKDIITPTPDYRVVSDRPVPTVTLMACWPLWTTDQRMLVRGELTNITKLTERPI